MPAVLLFDEELVPTRLPSPLEAFVLTRGPGLDSTSWQSSSSRGRKTAPEMQPSSPTVTAVEHQSRVILDECLLTHNFSCQGLTANSTNEQKHLKK